MGTFTLKRSLLAAALAAAVVGFAAPASADDGVAVGGCDEPLSQPFLPWLDVAHYALAPDGGFENGASEWMLDGRAGVAAGNEPWNVGGTDDSSSLSLPAGSSATSPELCLSLLHPTVRFFARGNSLVGGLVLVEAEVDIGGIRGFVPVGLVPTGPGWAPTLPLPVLANLTAASARLRFTAIGGNVVIDDVYIDPFKVP